MTYEEKQLIDLELAEIKSKLKNPDHHSAPQLRALRIRKNFLLSKIQNPIPHGPTFKSISR